MKTTITTIMAAMIIGAAIPASARDSKPKAATVLSCLQAVSSDKYSREAKQPKLYRDSNNITPSEREAIRKSLDEMIEWEKQRIRKCLSTEQAEQVGWLTELSNDLGDKQTLRLCGLKMKPGVSSVLGNAAAALDLDIKQGPFFVGMQRARDFRSANGYAYADRRVCPDLYRDFGPHGERFPGLIEK